MGNGLMPNGLFCLILAVDMGKIQVDVAVLIPSSYLPGSLICLADRLFIRLKLGTTVYAP